MPSYEEVTQRAGSLRAMTGLTEAEFTALLPHFERALAAYLQDRTIDGQPRTSRRYSAYDNCPLPTVADKLLFILTYLKQNPIQDSRFAQILRGFKNYGRVSGTEEVRHGRDPADDQ